MDKGTLKWFGITGQEHTVTITKQKHGNGVLYKNFHTFEAVTESGVRVIAILLKNKNKDKTPAINLDLLEVSGDCVLKNKGLVCTTDFVFFLKEDYFCNIHELNVYLDPLSLEHAQLSSKEEAAVKKLRTTSFKTNGQFSSLSRQLSRDVTRGLKTIIDSGFKIGDFGPDYIAVQILPSNDIRFKLIINCEGDNNLMRVGKGYCAIVIYCLSLERNEQLKPVFADLIRMLDPETHHTILPPDAILPPEAINYRRNYNWNRVSWLQRVNFSKNPESIQNHASHWQPKRGLGCFHELSDIIKSCGGYRKSPKKSSKKYSKKYPGNVAVSNFLEDMNNICLGGGKYVDEEGNTQYHPVVGIRNWEEIIRQKSVAVADLTKLTDEAGRPRYTSDQFEKPVHLIRFIRNNEEHIKLIEAALVEGSVEGFFYFFDELFPYLLVQSYRVFQKHFLNLQSRFPRDSRIASAEEYIV